MPFVARQIEAAIQSLLPKYPVIALTGPRQSGKTTLLKNLLPGYEYVSLEDANVRDFATSDPVGFLEAHPRRAIFDEAQRAPGLFSYLQTAVDRSGEMGQFVLSGSQNFHLMERVTQSLAGRVAIFRLLPFDFSELRSAGMLPTDWRELLVKGSFPPVYDRGIDPAVFFSNYVQTYIDRDVSQLSNVQDLRRFRNFVALCAARTGQLLNLNSLATDCGISQPTAKSWLSILEGGYIAFQLPPFFENFNKRVVKTPKLYFYDTGLVAFLLGVRGPADLTDPSFTGLLFENMVVAEVHKQNFHRYQLREFWFWRDSAGNEVDLLSKTGLRFDATEIKSTKTVMPEHFKGLDYFEAVAGGRTRHKRLVYGGSENQSRTGFEVVSWQDAGAN